MNCAGYMKADDIDEKAEARCSSFPVEVRLGGERFTRGGGNLS